ncbi:transcriptional regulator [Clostridium sp. AM58-1XD]|nr:transcriptional regulator [Clostridium sp. AM58-1XD]
MDYDIKKNMPYLERIVDMLEQHLGKQSEIVVHDLTKGVESTIIDIRNGDITGRTIGGCGSNLGLEMLKGTTENGDRFNYVTKLKNGRILRSSTMYFRNGEGQVAASLCVNTDITESVRLENYLKEINHYEEEGGESEVLVNDVGQLLEYYLQRGQEVIGKVPEDMSKEDKFEFIKYLDSKGAFLIAKSGEKVQEFLNISKYLMYKYLDMIREEDHQTEET